MKEQITYVVNDESKKFFFNKRHTNNGLDNNWIPVTVSVPCKITPRPGFEDGLIKNIHELRKFQELNGYKWVQTQGIPDENLSHSEAIKRYNEGIEYSNSTDIAGNHSRGYGKLSFNGFFEFRLVFTCDLHDRKKIPMVGDKLYVDSSFYMSHGSDDFVGGLATIEEISEGLSAGKPCLFVIFKERPDYSYNYPILLEKQSELMKKFGNQVAHPEPDVDEPWIQDGDIVNGKVYHGKDIW